MTTNKRFNINKLAIALVILFATVGCEKAVKTRFTNCSELTQYIGNMSYTALKSSWGEGIIDDPWDASAVGEFDMLIYVKWNNVTCNGKPVSIIFENNHIGITDAFDKNPNKFHGVHCDDYK